MPVAARRDGLGALTPAARAAYLLTRMESLTAEAACALLRSAGVRDPETAVGTNPDVTPGGIAPVVATEPSTVGTPASRTGGAKTSAADAEVRKDLDRILRRLTAALAEQDAGGPEAARLLNLIAAVQREQQRVRAAEPR